MSDSAARPAPAPEPSPILPATTTLADVATPALEAELAPLLVLREGVPPREAAERIFGELEHELP